MKKSIMIIALVVLTISLSTNLFAQNTKVSKFHPQYDKIEKSLLIGLKSDNFGLRMSSAFMLGEMESSKSVNDLVNILRTEEDEGAKVMAALSLVKIGTDRALFMVKRTIQFADSEKFSNRLDHIYKAHLHKDSKKQRNDVERLVAYLESQNDTQID
ncbi:MAG: HEAT repeat domain-containing protein [Melioribacteraceae bacterium]|nr:HEAT repeat domain-containing protein [Melioribacteraceae bacterium]